MDREPPCPFNVHTSKALSQNQQFFQSFFTEFSRQFLLTG